MKELKGTKTEANLLEAFSGESQARNKYTYYASKAKKTDMSKSPSFFLKQQRTKRSMLRFGLSFFITVYLTPRKI